MAFWQRTELATWLVAVAIYAGWIALTLHANELPLWALVPLGGYLVAWHGSLQHEIIHGHPTRWRWLNTAIALPPLAVYLPFANYRDSHLEHHAVDELTHPADDPESRYVDPRWWLAMGPLGRAVRWIERPLLGRMFIGPVTSMLRFWRSEVARIARRDFTYVTSWLAHFALVALVGYWLLVVCELSIGRYLLAFVYPGLALTLMRSFTEHRPAATQTAASAVVESGPLASLMYLNNNLHVLHHADASLPWYELPARFAARRTELLAANDNFYFRGYLGLLWRFGLVPMDTPRHPPREQITVRDESVSPDTPALAKQAG